MQSKFIMVNNIRTHYIEAGEGEDYVVLIHGAEPGADATNCYEYNIEAISRYFHVLALDMVGFGQTDKLFHFGDMRSFRKQHIRDFLQQLGVDAAHFIGNSMGGNFVLEVASMEAPLWNIKKIVSISGGGPNNPEAHKVLGAYDCTREHMKKIHELLFYGEKWKSDEYIEKRYQSSIQAGAWEALNVARFVAPGKSVPAMPLDYSESYRQIKNPVLLHTGKQDTLKFPEMPQKLGEMIPHIQVVVLDECCHEAQIEYADEWNRQVVQFLRE